jgi:hypothetical protein
VSAPLGPSGQISSGVLTERLRSPARRLQPPHGSAPGYPRALPWQLESASKAQPPSIDSKATFGVPGFQATAIVRLPALKPRESTMNTAIVTADRAAAFRSDPRWAAVIARAPAADGSFFYSVKTTGVFCQPSCGARPARPENVQFHRTAADAQGAGFRPCKRCKPRNPWRHGTRPW